MKSILIILNILLAGAVLWGGVRFFKNIAPTRSQTAFTVKKRTPKEKKHAPERKQTVSPVRSTVSSEANVKQIVELNLFDPDRCPNAGFWGGGNARVEMTLVGTFKIGSTQGAIILQKSQSRNFPVPPFGNMMNPGGMMQRRQGIGRGSFGGNTQMGPNSGNAGNRRQIGGTRSIQANRNAQGSMLSGQPGANTQPVVYKQYVRLGETMANGYKLTEIDRNRVVLKRGGDRLELELVDASANVKQPARRTRPANQTQIMQQMLQSMQNMQRAQMMQGFQMMRMNQQNMQNMPGGGRGGMMPRAR